MLPVVIAIIAYLLLFHAPPSAKEPDSKVLIDAGNRPSMSEAYHRIAEAKSGRCHGWGCPSK